MSATGRKSPLRLPESVIPPIAVLPLTLLLIQVTSKLLESMKTIRYRRKK
jgi:hypothetical protein